MERHVFERMAEIDRDHWWFVGRRKILTALIARFRPHPRSLRILEVGCGTGSNLPMLMRFGEVEALEPDAQARAVAATRTGLNIIAGGIEDAPLADGRYDLIVMFDVLEHIEDDVAALRALLPKLAPGGRLMLTVPAIPWLWSGHDLAHHHKRRYTAASLGATLSRADYRLLHRTAFNTLLLPAVAAVRLVRRVTRREGGDAEAMPRRLPNRFLGWLFGAERHAAVRGWLPYGVSLAVVAAPAGDGSTR